LVLAHPVGVDQAWAVITDESPCLKTLWQYGLRFRIEQLLLESKSGALQLEGARRRNAGQLEKLYLVTAVALLYGTLTGVTLQVEGWRQQVDPHWKRGLSYLKIGWRPLQGVVAKNRPLMPFGRPSLGTYDYID
jgi:hypothetical protein